jgi:acetoin utilization deacetylase AcuC-like enzyme
MKSDRIRPVLCPAAMAGAQWPTYNGPIAQPLTGGDAAMTLLYTDPLFLRHDTGQHPERPERLRSISARLEKAGLVERCTRASYTPLSGEVVNQVHEPQVLERVRQAAESGGDWLDGDTFVSAASFDVALAAAGACASAVEAVLSGADRTALCLVRPPGHHATPTHSMGFCLFNNIALAAHRARQHGLTRLLIVDWDVHHGNGTQDIFYGDPEVMFFSIHRFGYGFYPGTGDANETGSGPGLGFTRNEPLPYGTRRLDYQGCFRNALEESADRIKPELVLLSAGFDAHRDDPIGKLGLEAEDFAVLTREVLDVARVHAGGRVVSCLEGGYDLDALAESVQAHLEGLLSCQ